MWEQEKPLHSFQDNWFQGALAHGSGYNLLAQWDPRDSGRTSAGMRTNSLLMLRGCNATMGSLISKLVLHSSHYYTVSLVPSPGAGIHPKVKDMAKWMLSSPSPYIPAPSLPMECLIFPHVETKDLCLFSASRREVINRGHLGYRAL